MKMTGEITQHWQCAGPSQEGEAGSMGGQGSGTSSYIVPIVETCCMCGLFLPLPSLTPAMNSLKGVTCTSGH